jgi:hypothetical protein
LNPPTDEGVPFQTMFYPIDISEDAVSILEHNPILNLAFLPEPSLT